MTALYDAFARFYDLEYGHKDNDLDFYLNLAQKIDGPVLEVGSGTGRVSFDLARDGIEVVGVENSSDMLTAAENNRQQYESESLGPLTFVQADMQDFQLERTFPLCIVPFRTFLHNLTQDEQIKTLRTIHRHLEPGGILAMDLFVPLYDVMSKTNWNETIEPDELADPEAGVRIEVSVTHEPAAQMLTIRNTYHDSVLRDTTTVEMPYRYIFRFEMEALLRMTGFEVKQVFGGFGDEPYDYKSGIMVFVARSIGEKRLGDIF